MKEVLPPSRLRSLPSVLGLLTASVLCLCAGSLLAASCEGLLGLLLGTGGFAGYVFFFAHALKELGLPSVLVEVPPPPDGEVRRELVFHAEEAEASDRTRGLTAAA